MIQGTSRETSTDLHSYPSVQLSCLWYSVLSTLDVLFSVDSQLCLLTIKSLLGSSWAPLLCCGLETIPRQSSGVMERLISQASLFFVASCPGFGKLFFPIFFLFFSCSRWEGKHHIFPVISSWPEVEVTSFLLNQRFLITSFVVSFLMFIHSKCMEQLQWTTIMLRISIWFSN